MTGFKAKTIGAAAGLLALGCAGAALAGDVTVTATGVQARTGTLYAALQGRDQFMQTTFTRGALRENPTAGTVELVFRDVPAGDYAITLLHDEDDDRRMGMNGMFPREGYGMVRREELRDSPTFDMVKVAVPASGSRFSTEMVYYDGRMPTGAPR